MMVNYRPEYRHNWGSKTYYTQLRLDPLGAENTAELLSAMMGDGSRLLRSRRRSSSAHRAIRFLSRR